MRVAADTMAARLARVRTFTHDAEIDALVVTHLPNIRYLTGFTGSAGAVVLLPGDCALIVDFRYVTFARALAEPFGGLFRVETFERSYDEAIVELLRRAGARHAGIEAAYLPVARFNAISSALAAKAPMPLDSHEPAPTLVPTERVVERARMVKDAEEIAALREGGRRLAAIAARLSEWARPGRTEREVADDIESAMRASGFSRPAFETIAAAGPNSALPHARPGDRPLQDGDATVLDFGGVYDGY
ncbi:MAG: M24 family metallopeptidase, partial [Vicinamibacterales bacterium]